MDPMTMAILASLALGKGTAQASGGGKWATMGGNLGPLGAGIGSLFDPGSWGRGGGGGNDKNDPLADIREQLMALSFPIEEMKAQIASNYEQARKTGLETTAESALATRQVPGSIHAKLVEDFMDKMARGESAAMLGADVAGQNFELNKLKAAGSFQTGLDLNSLLAAGALDVGAGGEESSLDKEIEDALQGILNQSAASGGGGDSLGLEKREGVLRLGKMGESISEDPYAWGWGGNQ